MGHLELWGVASRTSFLINLVLINAEILTQWQLLHWLCVALFPLSLIDQSVLVNKALIVPKWIGWIQVLFMQRRYELLRYLVFWIKAHRSRSIFFSVCMAQRTSVHKVFCDLSFICCNPWTDLEFLDCWRVISVNLCYCRGLLLHCRICVVFWSSQHRVVLCLSICMLFRLDNFHAALVWRFTRDKCWFYLLSRQRICWHFYCSINVFLGSLLHVLLTCCLVL